MIEPLNRRLRALGVILALGLGGAIADSDPWVGTWSGASMVVELQGGEGQYTGTAQVQDMTFRLSGYRSGGGLVGVYAHEHRDFPWRAELHGDLMVFHVDGQSVRLTRSDARAMAVEPASQSEARLSPQAQEWQAWIAGRRLTQLSSYYSGPSSSGAVGGGYSDRRVMDVCSDGRFFHSATGSVAAGGDGVSGYGAHGDTQSGLWRVIEHGDLVGLELQWQDGSVSQHRLDYQGGQTLIDGTRTFITRDNASCT